MSKIACRNGWAVLRTTSASGGGSQVGGAVVWNASSVPTPTVNGNGGVDPGLLQVSFTVQISNGAGIPTGTTITNDGIVVTSAQGIGANGSPFIATISPQFAFTLSPASQSDGTNPGKTITYSLTIQNTGFGTDSYNLAVSGNAWPTSIFDASNSNPISQISNLGAAASAQFTVRVSVPATATNGASDSATIAATSVGNSTVHTATIKTTAVVYPVLIVDQDGAAPNVQSYYTGTLNSLGVQYNYWNLQSTPVLPPNYMQAHKAIVWFTGNTYPGPIVPYEAKLKDYLDNGGHFFLSGQDVLDQAAGTTAFVHDYLHVNWDGSETQNDKATTHVNGVVGNPVTNAIGSIAIDHSVLGAAFEDRITLVAPAQAAFKDDAQQTDADTVDTGTYKVMFLAFPFEAYGSASDKATLMSNALNWFGP